MVTQVFSPPHWKARQPVLASARNLKMAQSAHAYVRGSTAKFYEWLDSLAPDSLPQGPAIWVCGDCHLGNLGPVADAERNVEIQIRDFDQTVIGNPAHDLIRLGLSLAMAARGSDLPGVTTARIVERMIEGYTSAFAPGARNKRPPRPQAVTAALRQSERRSWRHLARERLAGGTIALPRGKRFWTLSRKERAAIAALFESAPLKELARSLSHRHDTARVDLVDAAYWMKGCSSLGLLRFALLLDIEGRASARDDLCLIDVKEATQAIAPRYGDAEMPRKNAERVREGARHLSPSLGDRMIATELLGRSVFVRELLPEDLKLELTSVAASEAETAAHYLAHVVALAHARQLGKDDRRAWRAELARNHTKSLDAPSWLWRSIVDLIATHERAYLEHCRRVYLAT